MNWPTAWPCVGLDDELGSMGTRPPAVPAVFLLALVIAGSVTAFRLPVTLFPQVDFPRVEVTLDAGDRPAEQMAMQVTIPVEEMVRRVPGVLSVRSTTSRGTAEVSVNFPGGAT